MKNVFRRRHHITSPVAITHKWRHHGIGTTWSVGAFTCENSRSTVRGNSGRDPFNQNSDRSDREKWSTSKGGPVFSKPIRLDRTDPLSFGPKFLEILVEWIAPSVFRSVTSFVCGKIGGYTTFYFEKEEVNLDTQAIFHHFFSRLVSIFCPLHFSPSTNEPPLTPPCSHLFIPTIFFSPRMAVMERFNCS